MAPKRCRKPNISTFKGNVDLMTEENSIKKRLRSEVSKKTHNCRVTQNKNTVIDFVENPRSKVVLIDIYSRSNNEKSSNEESVQLDLIPSELSEKENENPSNSNGNHVLRTLRPRNAKNIKVDSQNNRPKRVKSGKLNKVSTEQSQQSILSPSGQLFDANLPNEKDSSKICQSRSLNNSNYLANKPSIEKKTVEIEQNRKSGRKQSKNAKSFLISKEDPEQNVGLSTSHSDVEKLRSEVDVSNKINIPSTSSRPKRLKKMTVFKDLENEKCQNTHKLQLQPIKKIILKRPEIIEAGCIVLVKWQAPYPHWPALIKNKVDNRIDVMFFGDNSRTAKVKIDQIFDFQSNDEYIIKILKSSQWNGVYKKAIREAEMCAEIPLESSIFNIVAN